MRQKIVFIFLVLGTLGSASQALAGTATIDATQTNQVIRGFGAASAWNAAGNLSPYAQTLWAVDNANGHAGLSMLRTRIDPTDAGSGAAWNNEAGPMTLAKSVNPNITIWSTEWSPPATYKNNNSVDGGGSNGALNSTATFKGAASGAPNSADTGYAGYLVRYIQYIQSKFGVSLYAVSCQNEPDWDPTYEAAIWNAGQFDVFTGAFHSALSSAGLPTRIMITESFGDRLALAATTMDDATNAPFVSIIAGHIYGGGPNALSAGSFSHLTTQDNWETEISDVSGAGPDNSMTSGLTEAGWLFKSIVNANMNAFHHWWIWGSDNSALITSSGVSKKLMVLGQYSKFVRPGFYRMGATASPSAGVSVAAFKSDSSSSPATIVIVAINGNSSTTSQTFGLNGLNVTSVTPWVTDNSNNLVQQAAVPVSGNSFTYNLTGPSVVSFVGVNNGTGGPTATFTSTMTNTPVPPTATRTNTPVPPTSTNTPVPPTATFTSTSTRTNTPVPPTATNTAVPPTSTNTPVPTFTPTATKTNSPVPPTSTNTPIPTSTPTTTKTNTPVPPTATSTLVPPTSTSTQIPPTTTNTPAPPTSTATVVPPTATSTQVPPTSTNTAVPPTFTSTSIPPTVTNTPMPPTATQTLVSSATNTPMPPTSTASTTPTLSATLTASPSASPTPTFTLLNTSTPTASSTPTSVPPTSTNTPVPPTATNTSVPPTNTLTQTPAPPTSTNTPAPPTSTNTPVPPTPTNTPTATTPFTHTPTSTNTATFTSTSTDSMTPTATPTNSPVPPTATPSKTFTPTGTPTPSFTFTPTSTDSTTATPTSSPSLTSTPSASPTSTLSKTATETPAGNQEPIVYPNPATGPTVKVLPPAYQGLENVRVILFTASFRKVYDNTFWNVPGGTPITLDLENRWDHPLANGIYYVMVIIDGHRSIARLLILR